VSTPELLIEDLLVERGQPSGFWFNVVNEDAEATLTDKQAVELIKFLLEWLVNEKN